MSGDDFEVTVPGNALAYYGTTVGDWDTITIAGAVFSGTKITVDGTPEYKIDVKQAPSFDGARETPIGYIPARVTVAIELWEDASNPPPPEASLFAGFALLVARIRPKPGKTGAAVITVDYPTLRVVGITRFYVVGTPLIKNLGNQTMEGRLILLEYFPAPKAAGKQSQTVTAGVIDAYGGNIEQTAPAPVTAPSKNNTGPT